MGLNLSERLLPISIKTRSASSGKVSGWAAIKSSRTSWTMDPLSAAPGSASMGSSARRFKIRSA